MRGFFFFRYRFAVTKCTDFIHFFLTFASPLDEAMNTPTDYPRNSTSFAQKWRSLIENSTIFRSDSPISSTKGRTGTKNPSAPTQEKAHSTKQRTTMAEPQTGKKEEIESQLCIFTPTRPPFKEFSLPLLHDSKPTFGAAFATP